MKLLKKTKRFIYKLLLNIEYNIYCFRCNLKKQPKFILFGTPKHGNLGDHAIALAEYRFFNDLLFPQPFLFFRLFYLSSPKDFWPPLRQADYLPHACKFALCLDARALKSLVVPSCLRCRTGT